MRENTSQTRRSFLQLLGISGVVGLTGVASATPGRASGPKEDEILVGVSASASSAGDMESHVDQHVPGKAAVVHSNETLRYVAVKFPGSETAREHFIDAITKQDGIKYAEKNTTHTAFLTPSDPLLSDQYAPQQVNAPAAWNTTLGSSDVTIAVIDTGVDYTHIDLDAQFGSDKGYDFADDDSDPMPVRAIHGTHVAGIASATTDNGTGVAGISNSTLISGRVLGSNGRGSLSDIADGIIWATDQGADIINMSLGGGGYTQTMKNAVSYAVNNGTLPICANGNAGNSSVSYPAAYDECVAVAASREGGEFVDKWRDYPGGSNYGPKTDVIAPGERVLSSVPGNRYKSLSGTSMACPATSGVAALGLAADPDLTVSGLRNRLKTTAVDIGEPSEKQGAGRVDANNIVDAAGDGGDDGGGGEESTNQTVSGSLSGGYDYATYSWNWEYSDPGQLTLELAGPSAADFDLYVNEGTTAVAGPRSHDYASTSPNSQETITIDSPATSSPLQITVDSYSGWGSFDLTFTEFK
jgi:serine protease